MSRAFVKEGDGEELDDTPPRPPRVQPCYMTVGGVARLRAEFEALQRETTGAPADSGFTAQAGVKRAQKRLHELSQILQEAVPIDTVRAHDGNIRFGATVELIDTAGERYVFQIVGEDETAPAQGKISWVSPLGRQLIGKAVGDEVTWVRPNGTRQLEIVALTYV